MVQSNDSFSDALTTLSKHQIQQAGQRYTPGIHPQAPNIKIESLYKTLENVGCGARAYARFQSVLDKFSKAWELAKHCSQRAGAIQKSIDDALAFLSPLINRLLSRDESAGAEWRDLISNIHSDLSEDWNHWYKEERRLEHPENETRSSPKNNEFRRNLNAIEDCLAIVRGESDYTRSPAFKVLFDPFLLVKGKWGTGKTHLMCDFTQDRIKHNLPSLLVLAKNLKGDIITKICSKIETRQTVSDTFDQIDKLASENRERVIVIVDGVNEGHRDDWRKAITTLRSLIADRRNIGLIVTCRTPFETIAIKQTDYENFHQVEHVGFDDREFEAQKAFFDYYKLPLPEVPLLDQEFSHPLTLKLICQAFQNLSVKKLKQGFAGIASGQKGMTYVLESFVNNVGESIERDYDLRPKGCWELLKGNSEVKEGRKAGFAPCMAARPRGFVRPSEADQIIAANYPEMKPATRKNLLEELRTNGLIEEDVISYSSTDGFKSRIVFRLPYQRFSDHLTARYLLKKYLDVSSTASIKRSFRGNSRLARIFRVSRRHNRSYEEPGLAQALITEFPERVAKRLPPLECELFFMLPKRNQILSAYFNPFIEGMYWRKPSSFSKGTDTIIGQYLKAGSRACWEQMIDALAAVSTKPRHPYNARRLYDFLSPIPMVDRDLRWSEYLRRPHASPTIRRLLTWAEKLNAAKMTPQTAKGLVVLLSLVLTTVVRRERDLGTKALVLIGERFPGVLFSHTETSLGFNDPYVPERMLAASYGTTLSLVDSETAETAETFRPLLGEFAMTLYQKMFGPNASNTTHHTLTRDYALGIIENAQRVNCVVLPNTANQDLVPPFPNIQSKFTSDGSPNPSIQERIGRAIRMDFSNYTIGRLIPNRINYDANEPDYVQVHAKIEQRIFDLGYREGRFKDPDNTIDRISWNASDEKKIDRYGKKYSWIAYFEMWGELEAQRNLPKWRERTSDCGIDPSFPTRPPLWTPQIPDLFGDRSVTNEVWVKDGSTPNWHPLLVVPEINGFQGDWVLAEGYIRGVNESLDRELFAFMRGVFIQRKNVQKFKAKFLDVDYPNDTKLPRGASEYYLYAGEAGRRSNYAQHLLLRDGQYGRQILPAFEEWVPVCPREETPSDKVRIEFEYGEENDTFNLYFDNPNPKQSVHKTPGIRVEIPYINFGWEPYHSSYNDFSNFKLPAPSLIQRLRLTRKNRGVDFYDTMGVPGTLYREAEDSQGGTRHSLLYVRADILRRYLMETRQVLVWCIWGTRDWAKKMEGVKVIEDPTRQRIYRAYGHVHRSFFQWLARDRAIGHLY